MSDQEGKYNIKAASKLLGIQSGTLRAWERRYNMIAPMRNESGHRLYTEEHIHILKWLLEKVNSGFTISQAVNLLEENEEILTKQKEEGKNPIDRLKDKLLHSLLNFQKDIAEEVLNKLFSLYTVDKVVFDVIGKVYSDIGEQSETGKITSAHEQYAYSILRFRIGMILHTLTGSYLPKAICVCGPDEKNDLDLLIFTYYMRSRGFEVIYLGVCVKEEDFDKVIEAISPDFLLLSSNRLDNIKRTCHIIDRLSSKFPLLHIGLAGKVNTATTLIPNRYNKYLVGVKKKHWEQWIKVNLGH